MNRFYYLTVSFVISLLLTLTLLKTTGNLGIMDWDQHLVFAEVIRNSVRQFGSIPLWNPFHCGGTSLIGFPENEIFSVSSLSSILFGAMPGYKIAIGIYIFTGFYGFYLLGRYLRMSASGSFIMAISYLLSGHYLQPFASGMTNFLSLSFLPYIFLFLLKSIQGATFKYLVLTALFLSLQFFAGFHYIGLTFIFISLFVLLSLRTSNWMSLLKKISVIAVLFALISAPKLLPSLETTLVHSTFINTTTSGYSIQSFLHSLFSRQQTNAEFDRLSIDSDLIQGRSYRLDENGMYVGIICLIFFLMGIIRYGRKYYVLIFIFFLLMYISFGDFINPSLYTVIREIPLAQHLRVAQRYHWYYMFIFSIFAGFGFTFVQRILANRKIHPTMLQILTVIIICITFTDLYYVNTKELFHTSFIPEPSPRIESSQSFVQTCGRVRYDALGWVNSSNRNGYIDSFSSQYLYMLENKGVARSCYEVIKYPVRTACVSDPSYIGEHYLKESRLRLIPKYWSYNVISIDFTSDKSDLLIINQNYNPNWFVFDGKRIRKTKEDYGLLAIPVARGDSSLYIFYFPVLFFAGLLISAFTLLYSYLKLVRSSNMKF